MLSELILPPGYRRPSKPKREPVPVFEPYHSEALKIVEVTERLNHLFAWQGEEPWTQRQFETTAHNLYGEIGIIVRINWLQAMDPETGEELPFKAPEITPIDRVKKESERDHDRIKHEVTSGIADGQRGFIREDGSKHEDPIRKVIT